MNNNTAQVCPSTRELLSEEEILLTISNVLDSIPDHCHEKEGDIQHVVLVDNFSTIDPQQDEE